MIPFLCDICGSDWQRSKVPCCDDCALAHWLRLAGEEE